jgi:hypothetical protein
MDWLASARCLSPAAPSIRSAEAHGAIRQALATVSRRDHQRLIEEGLTPRWSGLHCRARHTHGTDNNKSIAIPCHVRTWCSRLAASAGDTPRNEFRSRSDLRQGSRHYQSCICEPSHSRWASETNAPNIPALGVRPSFVNNRNPRLSEQSGTNALDIGPSPLGAGFSAAASGLAMGRALVVTDDSTAAKAAAAITAPMNFNTRALNLRPQPRQAVLETRRLLRRRAALSILKVSAQTVCRHSLRMPTSHVLAVWTPTHSDYRGQRLYRAGHTPAESACANAPFR